MAQRASSSRASSRLDEPISRQFAHSRVTHEFGGCHGIRFHELGGMVMTATLRIAAALAVGSVLVLGLPSGAVAGDDEAVRSRLTVKGQPLAALVRTEPMAPFVAFEPGFVRVGAQAGGAGQAANGDKPGEGNRAKTLWISAGIGAGIGLSMGGMRGYNEGSVSSPILPLWGAAGFGVGVGIGALVAAIAGN